MEDERRSLRGKRVLVTGGGSGIGLASALLFSADGAAVTIAGRTEPRLRAATATIEARCRGGGGSVDFIVCDATDGEQVRRAVEFAEGDAGRLDAAVSVPGGGSFAPILLHSAESFMADVGLNTLPVFWMVKYAGSHMARSGGGWIVAISSTAAVQSSPFLSAYCAGNAAVEALVRVAADELGAAGVRVNAVRPGLTHTDATDGMFALPDVLDRYREQQPLVRTGEPEDIAALVRFLAGPDSSWMTGQCIASDGGHTLRRFPDLKPLADAVWGREKVDAAARGDID